jgi:hypothetical protein
MDSLCATTHRNLTVGTPVPSSSSSSSAPSTAAAATSATFAGGRAASGLAASSSRLMPSSAAGSYGRGDMSYSMLGQQPSLHQHQHYSHL